VRSARLVYRSSCFFLPVVLLYLGVSLDITAILAGRCHEWGESPDTTEEDRNERKEKDKRIAGREDARQARLAR
jgi:hypothetical protein